MRFRQMTSSDLVDAGWTGNIYIDIFSLATFPFWILLLKSIFTRFLFLVCIFKIISLSIIYLSMSLFLFRGSALTVSHSLLFFLSPSLSVFLFLFLSVKISLVMTEDESDLSEAWKLAIPGFIIGRDKHTDGDMLNKSQGIRVNLRLFLEDTLRYKDLPRTRN